MGCLAGSGLSNRGLNWEKGTPRTPPGCISSAHFWPSVWPAGTICSKIHTVSSQRNDATCITFLHYLNSPFREGSVKRPHIPALLPLGALRIARCGKIFLGCHGNKTHTMMWKVAQSCHDIKNKPQRNSCTITAALLHGIAKLGILLWSLAKGMFFPARLFVADTRSDPAIKGIRGRL